MFKIRVIYTENKRLTKYIEITEHLINWKLNNKPYKNVNQNWKSTKLQQKNKTHIKTKNEQNWFQNHDHHNTKIDLKSNLKDSLNRTYKLEEWRIKITVKYNNVGQNNNKFS